MRPFGFKDLAMLSRIEVPDPSLWLRADAGTFTNSGMTTPASVDGDSVGGWQDQSGAGHHATQSTSGQRATLKTNILNGFPVVRLDGVDDWLSGSIDALSAQTWFWVCQKRSAVGSSKIDFFALNQSFGRIQCFNTFGSGFSYYRDQGGSAVSIGGTPTSFGVLVMRFTSTGAASGWWGGGSGVSFDPDNAFASSTGYVLGNTNSATANDPGDFDFAEVKRFSSSLSLNQVDAVASQLASRYGLSWSAAA